MKLFFALLAATAVVLADELPRIPLYKLVNLYINTQYAGVVTIGDQAFLMVFDSTSCNVIIAGQDCVGGSCVCPSLVKYNAPNIKYLSDTPEQVRYFIRGRATGREIQASLAIKNLTSPEQGILLADELSDDVCLLSADGVLGVAPPACQNPFGTKTVFANFFEQNLIAPVFSIHHARYEDGEHFGEIVFGGSDLSLVEGEFTYAPLVEDATWKFQLDGVRIGDVEIAPAGTLAVVDTGKSGIRGPGYLIYKIHRTIGCTVERTSDAKICKLDCDKVSELPDVLFKINGTDFTVPAAHYIQKQGHVCFSAFQPCDSSSFFSLGDIFIDDKYIEFNWGEKAMRIANSIHHHDH